VGEERGEEGEHRERGERVRGVQCRELSDGCDCLVCTELLRRCGLMADAAVALA
jgi:hypothetical protein